MSRALNDACRHLAETLMPREELQHRMAVRETVNNDRTINSQAIRLSMPWQVRDVFLPGAVAAGTQGPALEYPQETILRRVALTSRTATTGTAQVQITDDGGAQVTVSMPAGSTRGGSNDRVTIPAGTVMRVVVLDAGGAQDMTVSIFTS